jgi:hypothetical protein
MAVESVPQSECSTPKDAPDTGDPDVGNTSGEGGDVVEIVALSIADVLMAPLLRNDNDYFTSTRPTDNEAMGGVDAPDGASPRQALSITDLLEGSGKQVMKCSLNDLMFLVMLIMIKSTAEQRNSRYEATIDRKQISHHAANTVYDMKMAEAQKNLEADLKEAKMAKIMGWVSIAVGCVSVITAGLGGISGIGRAIGSVQKFSESTIKLLKVATVVTEVIDGAMSIAQSSFGIANSFVNLKIVNMRYKANIMGNEIQIMERTFETNMQQLRDMQGAYSTSQQKISSLFDQIKEALQMKQDTRMTVARNV